jgi:hypothetical protein
MFDRGSVRRSLVLLKKRHLVCLLSSSFFRPFHSQFSSHAVAPVNPAPSASPPLDSLSPGFNPFERHLNRLEAAKRQHLHHQKSRLASTAARLVNAAVPRRRKGKRRKVFMAFGEAGAPSIAGKRWGTSHASQASEALLRGLRLAQHIDLVAVQVPEYHTSQQHPDPVERLQSNNEPFVHLCLLHLPSY